MKICAGKFDLTHAIDAEWMRQHSVLRVYDLFVFDPERAVHCCSLTPSTECFHVRHALEFAPEATEEMIEDAETEASTWDADRVFYVDRVPKSIHERAVGKDIEYEEAIEAAIDWHNGNHIL